MWDPPARRLLCARYPHGNRPLFWRQAGSQVVVSSAIDVIRLMPGVSNDLHAPSILSLLRDGWNEDPERTAFREVMRVPAAHTLILRDAAAPRLRRHWDYPVPAPLRYRCEAAYVEYFSDVLDATVRDRVRGGSAAILLSGGMHAATIAVSARRVAPQADLKALTLVYPTLAPSDDGTLSVAVARHLGIVHELLDLEHYLPLEHLDDLAALPPQPFDESDLGFWRAAARRAAAHAPVALFGEDGDTLLHPPCSGSCARSRSTTSWCRGCDTGTRPGGAPGSDWSGAADWRACVGAMRPAARRDCARTPWAAPR